MTRPSDEFWLAIVFVCIAIGSCTWRHAAAFAQDMPPPKFDDQLQEAMRATFHAKHPVIECWQVREHNGATTCITEAQWKRMHADDVVDEFEGIE